MNPQEQLVQIQTVLRASKKDMVFLISFFRVPQPFKIRLQPAYSYSGYSGVAESTVKIKGKRQLLVNKRIDEITVEDLLRDSVRKYEAHRQ